MINYLNFIGILLILITLGAFNMLFTKIDLGLQHLKCMNNSKCFHEYVNKDKEGS